LRNEIKAKRWAYLAGLVDGDGSISLTEFESPKQVHFFFSVKVTSTQKAQINWLVQQFGGDWEKYTDKREANKPTYSWKVKGTHAKRILEGITPYLDQKKEAGLKALEYTSLPVGLENPELRSKYATEICALNAVFIPSEDRPWRMVIDRPSVLGKEQLAYAAGLLDAEGTFSSPTSTATSPQIQLSNTDQRMLDWMYNLFGGIVFSSKKINPEHRDAGLWRFSGGRCQKKEHLDRVKKCKELFLLSILPYMVQKRAQAILSLCLLRGDKTPQHCFDELKKLNQVGTQTTNTPITSSEVKIESDLTGDRERAEAVMLPA
jgi:hypothetical protein